MRLLWQSNKINDKAVAINNILYKHPEIQKAKESAGYNIFKLQLRESFLQLSCSAK